MVHFAGFCAYPHGGYATLGMFLTVATALAATCYGVASCRLFVLAFTTPDQVCFEEYFQLYDIAGLDTTTQADADGVCRVGIGLFQWLRPNDATDVAWNDGYCVGFQQTMLASMQDPLFDAARGLGVISVIFSFVLLGWTFFLSCLELCHWLQVFLLRLCCGGAMCCSGLSFLMKRSNLCTSMFSTRDCTLDQGGLAMITGCLLWMIALLISIFYLQVPQMSGALTNKSKHISKSATEKQRLAEEKISTTQIEEAYSFDSNSSWTKRVWRTPKTSNKTRSTTNAITVDDVTRADQMEVYISSSLNRIQHLTRDDDDAGDVVDEERATL